MTTTLTPTLFDLKPYTVKRSNPQMIDAIFTTRPNDPAAWAANDAGLLIGCISTDKRIYQTSQYEWAFKVEFIDNEYKAYDHATHLEAVKAIRPKYATVRDLMTPTQCKQDGIEYYPFDQIMAWAEELSQYAQNVIIIPKYECLDDIPDKFMLGYSVPTSYGGTPLKPELFRGRRVHLLGGTWKEQMNLAFIMTGSVVSIDNNWVQLIAKLGDYITPDGKRKRLENNGLGYIGNVRQVALTLSFGAMIARLRRPQ